MGYNKIANLLGKLTKDEIPKFTTTKWIEIFNQSNGIYNLNEDIVFKTNQLRNDLCDFNDAYIVVTGKITATNPDSDDDDIFYERRLTLKHSAPFLNCVLKINNQLIEDVQDLDIVMPMYNLLYYCKNFRKTKGSFWNYYPDMPNSEYVGNNERTRVFYSISDSKCFDYKTKSVYKLPDGKDALEDVKIFVVLKNLSNFMFKLDFLLTNPETELILKWSRDCVLTEKVTRTEKAEIPAQGGNPLVPAVPAVNTPSDLKFSITDCKLHVPVITLQAFKTSKNRNINRFYME